jgi:hypothetical protein
MFILFRDSFRSAHSLPARVRASPRHSCKKTQAFCHVFVLYQGLASSSTGPGDRAFLGSIQGLPVTFDRNGQDDESEERYLPKLETDINHAISFQQNAPNNAQKMSERKGFPD